MSVAYSELYVVSCKYLNNRNREYSQIEGICTSVEKARELALILTGKPRDWILRILISKCSPDKQWVVNELEENIVEALDGSMNSMIEDPSD